MSERIYAPFSENLQLTKVFQKIVKYIEYEIKKIRNQNNKSEYKNRPKVYANVRS